MRIRPHLSSVSVPIIPRKFWSNTTIQSLLIGVGTFLILSVGISRPLAGLHDWNSTFFGNAARNHLKYSLGQTKLGVLINAGPKSENLNFYVHHPVLMPLLLAASFQFFGIHEWSARLIPILSFVGLNIFLFLLVKKWWGSTTGTIASIFTVVSPLSLYYSKIPVHETVVMIFIGLTLWAYIQWLETKSNRWYLAIIGGLILSQLTSWAGYYLSAYLPIHALVMGMDKRQRSRLFALFIIAPILFTLHLAHSSWIKGGLTYLDFIDPFLYRINATNSSKMFGFTWIKFFVLQARWIVIHFTKIITISSISWVLVFIFKRWQRKPLTLPESFISLLLIFGITHSLIFRQQAFIHEYILTYMLPFMTLSSAIVIAYVYRLALKQSFLLGHTMLVVILVLVATERLPFVRILNHTGDSNPGYHLGKAINQISAPNDQILVLNTEFREFYETYFTFYADRATAFRNSLVPNDASSYDYIIIPTSHDYVSKTDKIYLYTNFPHRKINGGVIFTTKP